MVVRARKLLQYLQLADKISRDISRYICNFVAEFQNSYVFITLFLSEPLKIFCGTQSFRGTRFVKHWFKVLSHTICEGHTSFQHSFFLLLMFYSIIL